MVSEDRLPPQALVAGPARSTEIARCRSIGRPGNACPAGRGSSCPAERSPSYPRNVQEVPTDTTWHSPSSGYAVRPPTWTDAETSRRPLVRFPATRRGQPSPTAAFTNVRRRPTAGGQSVAPSSVMDATRIAAFPAFANLPAEELNEFAGALREAQVETGATVIRADDYGSAIYLIEEG